MHKPAAASLVLLLLLLPALVSAQQPAAAAQPAAQTPAQPAAAANGNPPVTERLCSTTELDTRLDAFEKDPTCGAAWVAFATQMDTPASLDQMSQQLAAFCQSPCGLQFDKIVADWRTWCGTNQASFQPLPGFGFPFEAYISSFGCSKPPASPKLCARIAMENDMAAADDTVGRCAFYTSCCAGELSRVLQIDGMAEAAAELEAACPGARAALGSRCAA